VRRDEPSGGERDAVVEPELQHLPAALTRDAPQQGIRVHDLRHTCATLLLSRGVHPKIVQELLGHSQISLTLDTYSHVLPTMQTDAAAVMERILAVNDR
jgi:integrase